MKELKVFLGGGVALLHGSDDKSDSYNKGYKPEVVAPVVADLNARDHKRYNITVKDFADLARHRTIATYVIPMWLCLLLTVMLALTPLARLMLLSQLQIDLCFKNPVYTFMAVTYLTTARC